MRKNIKKRPLWEVKIFRIKGLIDSNLRYTRRWYLVKTLYCELKSDALFYLKYNCSLGYLKGTLRKL